MKNELVVIFVFLLFNNFMKSLERSASATGLVIIPLGDYPFIKPKEPLALAELQRIQNEARLYRARHHQAVLLHYADNRIVDFPLFPTLSRDQYRENGHLVQTLNSYSSGDVNRELAQHLQNKRTFVEANEANRSLEAMLQNSRFDVFLLLNAAGMPFDEMCIVDEFLGKNRELHISALAMNRAWSGAARLFGRANHQRLALDASSQFMIHDLIIHENGTATSARSILDFRDDPNIIEYTTKQHTRLLELISSNSKREKMRNKIRGSTRKPDHRVDFSAREAAGFVTAQLADELYAGNLLDDIATLAGSDLNPLATQFDPIVHFLTTVTMEREARKSGKCDPQIDCCGDKVRQNCGVTREEFNETRNNLSANFLARNGLTIS